MQLSEGEQVIFEKSRGLMNRVSWFLNILGIWPMERTVWSEIRFSLFMILFISHLSMELVDLIMVLGNLELTVQNLTETGTQTTIAFKIIIMRFSKNLHSVIAITTKELKITKYEELEELRIFTSYHSKVLILWEIGRWMTTIALILWYIMPIQKYFISQLNFICDKGINNETAILETPFRLRTFFDISSIDRIIMIYIYEIPILFIGALLVAIMTVHGILIMNICTQLGILSLRIQNSSVNSEKSSQDIQYIFRKHVQKHHQLISMVQRLDDAFHINLMYEILSMTVVLALLSYATIRNFSNADSAALISFTVYISCVLLLIFANCMMGEFLHSEAENLSQAYQQCSWYTMPMEYKKSLLICMTTSRQPLNITAGKFFVYSLSNFVVVLKSAMTYVSMLRAMM